MLSDFSSLFSGFFPSIFVSSYIVFRYPFDSAFFPISSLVCHLVWAPLTHIFPLFEGRRSSSKLSTSTPFLRKAPQNLFLFYPNVCLPLNPPASFCVDIYLPTTRGCSSFGSTPLFLLFLLFPPFLANLSVSLNDQTFLFFPFNNSYVLPKSFFPISPNPFPQLSSFTVFQFYFHFRWPVRTPPISLPMASRGPPGKKFSPPLQCQMALGLRTLRPPKIPQARPLNFLRLHFFLALFSPFSFSSCEDSTFVSFLCLQWFFFHFGKTCFPPFTPFSHNALFLLDSYPPSERRAALLTLMLTTEHLRFPKIHPAVCLPEFLFSLYLFL